MIDYARLFTHRAARLSASPIQRLFDQTRGGGTEVVSFAVGAPDPALLPVGLLHQLADDAVTTYGPAVLQYGPVTGFGPLIEALLPGLHAAGVHTTASGVHITTGATGALHALCLLTLEPGARVLVAEPSYGVESGLFTAHGAHVEGVPCDTDGILPDALDAALRRAPAQFVYLVPTFANPTGITMPARRRAEIAAVVRRHHVLVVEDDAYSPLRYTGDPEPAMHAYVPDHTVHIGSLSKTFAPAARIGYLVAPTTLHRALIAVKEGIDMNTSMLTQAIATQFLTTRYDAHVCVLRREYGARLDAMCHALDAADIAGLTWRRPDGGMFVWVRGPASLVIDDAWTGRAAATGVLVMPGHHFHTRPDRGPHTIRLAFAATPVDRIRLGVTRLADVVANTRAELFRGRGGIREGHGL